MTGLDNVRNSHIQLQKQKGKKITPKERVMGVSILLYNVCMNQLLFPRYFCLRSFLSRERNISYGQLDRY